MLFEAGRSLEVWGRQHTVSSRHCTGAFSAGKSATDFKTVKATELPSDADAFAISDSLRTTS